MARSAGGKAGDQTRMRVNVSWPVSGTAAPTRASTKQKNEPPGATQMSRTASVQICSSAMPAVEGPNGAAPGEASFTPLRILAELAAGTGQKLWNAQTYQTSPGGT